MNTALVKYMQKRRAFILACVTAAIVALFYCSLIPTGTVITTFDTPILAANLRMRGPVPADPSIVIIGIDDSTFKWGDDVAANPARSAGIYDSEPMARHIGSSWPWDRSVFARLADKLLDAGARLVIIDFLLRAEAEGDSALAKVIREHPGRVILASVLRYSEGSGLPELNAPNADLIGAGIRSRDVVAFANLYMDRDGHVRRGFFKERINAAGGETDAFSLSALAAKKIKAGVKLPSPRHRRLINFAGPASTYRMIPMENIFMRGYWGRNARNGEYFRDKTVIVGPYEKVQFKDNHPTPLGRMPGPEIHANQLACLLDDEFIRELPSLLNVLVTVLVAAAVLAICILVPNVAAKIGLLAAMGLAMTLLSHIAFRTGTLFVPLSGMFTAIFVCGSLCILYDYVLERYQRRRVAAMFGTYVSPTVVDRIVDSGEEPTLGGEEVEITAFFSDVQEFSSISELLTPSQLVELMNEYLSELTRILHDHGGTLDKYIGDAMVAMFGAPLPVENHPYQACVAALRMQQAQSTLRERWNSEGDKWPDLCHSMRTRIGLNTGVVTVGNMGSDKRFNYTCMGDDVNLAARCETAAKHYGTYIMAAENTVRKCTEHTDEVIFRFLDDIVVKGRVTPLAVYSIAGLNGEIDSAHTDCIEVWSRGIAAYKARDWAKAIGLFEQSRELEPLQPGRDPGVHTTPSEVMLTRCHLYAKDDPGEDWDGVFVLPTK